MAASPRRVARGWWRTPAFRRSSRRRADLLLALTTLVALVLGSGAGAAVRAVGGAEAGGASSGDATRLGPVAIVLPAALGPWTTASSTAAEELGRAAAPGVELHGVWGALSPSGVVVSVLTVRAGTHGGVAQYGASVPDGAEATWSGGQEHASGSGTRDGLREDVLVVEASDGDLVILSVAGPAEAFASGALAEAFAGARVG